ncbi:hypothetical protein H0H87_012636 [Tephrocybe sp. NHM501043]|nr:hypothetical protein H0H87_012636 [Tephrocybe sp. NHM501043]
MGGVAGAIIGGSFERPAIKWPEVFRNIPLFVTYPYLLPCALAALVTFIGSILSCFLGRDGGPREGAIRLGPEKIDRHSPIPEESVPSSSTFDTHEQPSFVGKLKKQVSRRLSGYFAQPVHDAHRTTPLESPVPTSVASQSRPGTRLERTRTFSRTSRANGSAYGYGSYRNRLNSSATFGARHGSMASTLRRRRGSNMDGGETPDLNFTQRLLMANENAVTNIADLWVAAAMNVDNEDPFESDSEVEEGFEEPIEEDDEGGDPVDEESRAGRSTPAPRRGSHRLSNATSIRPKYSLSPHRPSQSHPSPLRHPSVSFSQPTYGTPTSRRYSTAAPSIFAHPGVKTPSAVLDAQQLLARSDAESQDVLDPLAAEDADIESLAEKPPSLTSQLPILVIVQYGMLALHTTTHDQVFMSYLVS